MGWGKKVCSNGHGHMTKMAAMPRPAISPDLGRRLLAFSLLYRLSGFHMKISGKIIKFQAFVFFSDNILKFTDKINCLNVN